MLRVIYEDGERHGDGEIGEAVDFLDGFHDEENEGARAFRWSGRTARLGLPAGHGSGADGRFLEMEVFSPYHDLSQTVTVAAGAVRAELELLHGWAPVSVRVPAAAEEAVLEVSKLLPAAHHPGDPRDLGIRVRSPRVHAEPERHAAVERQHANGVLNLREMLEGREVLESTPPTLGIDLHGVCNVKPPCVYCEWDGSKEQEGDAVDTPFTLETLEEWGDFFDNSVDLVNCSIGEPFMMKDTLDDLLDAFGRQGKTLEMTTNGQILTDKNIQKLLGRRIHLYISLDAGTAGTYAKLRNDKFDRILDNLRRLIAAKGGRSGLPKVHLVFMPMRVNLHELDDFIRLAVDLGVDRVVLRPLNYAEDSELDWVRNGHHFRYGEELLPWEELVRVSGRADELCRRLGMPLADQMGFGGDLGEAFPEAFERGRREAAEALAGADGADAGAPGGPVAAEAAPSGLPSEPASEPGPEPGPDLEPDSDPEPEPGTAVSPDEPLPSLGAEKLPLCIEPWKSLYILRRGVLPCCYGSRPLAPMESYRETWSAPVLQEIRHDLAHGRFHHYCRTSDACPIVRKALHDEAGGPETGWGERVVTAVETAWRAVDRLALGLPGRVVRPVKGPLVRGVRRLSRLLDG